MSIPDEVQEIKRELQEDAYFKMLKIFWLDGSLSWEKKATLAQVQKEMGINDHQHKRITESVQQSLQADRSGTSNRDVSQPSRPLSRPQQQQQGHDPLAAATLAAHRVQAHYAAVQSAQLAQQQQQQQQHRPEPSARAQEQPFLGSSNHGLLHNNNHGPQKPQQRGGPAEPSYSHQVPPRGQQPGGYPGAPGRDSYPAGGRPGSGQQQQGPMYGRGGAPTQPGNYRVPPGGGSSHPQGPPRNGQGYGGPDGSGRMGGGGAPRVVEQPGHAKRSGSPSGQRQQQKKQKVRSTGNTPPGGQQQPPPRPSHVRPGSAPPRASQPFPSGQDGGATLRLDPLIGRKVKRRDQEWGTLDWYNGIISDFNAATGEHCVLYDLNMESETFEWYKVRGAPSSACILLDERIDLRLLTPAAAKAASAGGRASGGGSGSGGGGGSSGAPTAKRRLLKAKDRQPVGGGGGGGNPARPQQLQQKPRPVSNSHSAGALQGYNAAPAARNGHVYSAPPHYPQQPAARFSDEDSDEDDDDDDSEEEY